SIKERSHLFVVAKQQPPKHSMPADTQNAKDDSDAFFYTGHDITVSLDLAPYRLNSKEMLIGFRIEHMWLPARTWDTYLTLYRIEGSNLRPVFDESVIERRYPGESPAG